MSDTSLFGVGGAPAAETPIPCTACAGAGFTDDFDSEGYAGRSFCVWCQGLGEELTDEECKEHWDNA